MSHFLGLDIGGANLKCADHLGHSHHVSFPLWKQPSQLTEALLQAIRHFPQATHLAVTMTGELADCFEHKRHGVSHIVSSVEAACAALPGPPVAAYWQTSGEFVDASTAIEFPLLTAASNWHLLASWVGRMQPHGPALLLDMGSTTTDLIPLRDGFPDTRGRDDLARLQHDELIYLGVRRTPIMALGETIDVNGCTTHVAAEYFATTDDLFLLTGDLPEAPHDQDTADGRSRTITFAGDRLSRMVCADRTMLDEQILLDMARAWQARMSRRILTAIERLTAREGACEQVILSGEGEFFLEQLLAQSAHFTHVKLLRLSQLLGSAISRSACAYAAAVLASERSWQFPTREELGN